MKNRFGIGCYEQGTAGLESSAAAPLLLQLAGGLGTAGQSLCADVLGYSPPETSHAGHGVGWRCSRFGARDLSAAVAKSGFKDLGILGSKSPGNESGRKEFVDDAV